MIMRYLHWMFVITVAVICDEGVAVGWRKLKPNIKKMTSRGGQMFNIMATEDLTTADIRLLRKDSNKSPESHPLLHATRMSKQEAEETFVTDWQQYFEWGFDLDSEYRPVAEAAELFNTQHFNSSLSTLLILHDRCGSARDSTVGRVLEALKTRNFDVNFNILLLDFSKFMCKNSPTTVTYKIGYDPQMQLLAAAVSEVLYQGVLAGQVTPDLTHLLGLGFGTPLAALVAKHLTESCGQNINSILGVDPPVRLVRGTVPRDYAQHVHMYTTYTRGPSLRRRQGLAHAHFVFGDPSKTRCTRDGGSCVQHGAEVFVSSLLYPRLFPARWCPSYSKFSSHFCDINDHAYISFPPDSSANGTYQLQLSPAFPYGMGPEGIFTTKEGMGGDDSAAEAEDLSDLSDQEYEARMQLEILAMKTTVMACLKEVKSKEEAVACVLETQKHVKRLVEQGLIRRGECEVFSLSPTGKRCRYSSRNVKEFFLPF